ncbi:Aminodeoxychorismate lyase [Methylacidimicrobium cyclopophantes]|uniref:branched-chain-amino-acid transaminase n=1 Tax=Methylacidimicrobium cyclopophantes TaxID=1041766 RepID=A0A5E6MIP5_9BACT|nr:aminotransferase class IV [Methylacidimicrobium cyclopophantes]VVM05936.1 Aminodeoxychorismate lyase [Methylacidimicrobium cyclopophantes]
MKSRESQDGPKGGSAFLPGFGVFETLRVEKGRAQFVEEHWRALGEAADALGIVRKIDFRPRASHLPPGETGRWRWVATLEKQWESFVKEKPPERIAYSLELAPQRVGSHNWDARFKTLSYLTRWQARRAVAADEALLCNERGELASGACSNLFWVRGKSIYTPSTEAGCRAGVIRGWILSRAEVVEGRYPLSDLEDADEIFLTNSWIGVMPVNRLLGRALPVGPVALRLRKELAESLGRASGSAENG